MRPLHVSAALLSFINVVLAQPALTEPPDFPQTGPGPQAENRDQGCFLLAQGSIMPGDVDWISVRLPHSSTRTVIDVDFPTGTGASALLAMAANGASGFNVRDNNNTRDALCGLHGASSPVGNLNDSVVDLGATSFNATVDIAVTGAGDTSFVGLHTQSFTYEVWVYALPVPCATDSNCNDNVACTWDQCDVASGDCSSTPMDDACNDDFFCNGQEWCDALLGCRAAATPSCDDGVDCTDDYCDFGVDHCVNEPWNGYCENEFFCDGEEVCDPVAGCQPGTPVNCDDGSGCTFDSCDEETWECVHTVSDDACNDGQFCNGVEQCDGAGGCAAGTSPCPGSMCRESDDRCVDCLTDANCDDGSYCNGAEHCNALGHCVSGAYPCGASMCRETDDQCVGCLADDDCNDGQFCNGQEFCSPSGACEQGAPACGPGLCRESDDRCVECLVDADCADESFCNGSESCNTAGVCVAGSNPCPGSMCREADESCVQCLTDTDCDDGVFCNGMESCVDGACGTGPNPCGNGFCRESDDRCVECLTDADCNDESFCNGSESCNTAGVCVAGSDPCPGSMCREADESCVQCLTDADCDDGAFCNGMESCGVDGACVAGVNACGNDFCLECEDRCVECLTDSDCADDLFCNGVERCDASGVCAPGVSPCSTLQSCNEATDQCVGSGFSVDIKPGACPTRVMTNGGGNLPVAIVGSDVRQIDPNSVQLSRADGVGSPVDAVYGNGQGPRYRDESGPMESCGCPDVGPDGNEDLVVSFKLDQVVKDLRLDKFRSGTVVELRVTGKMQDGTSFSATDCVTVQSTGRNGTAAQ